MNHLPEGELHLALARHAIDRDYLRRSNPELFDELWAEPSTRVIAMHNGQVLLRADALSQGPQLQLHEVGAVPSAQLRAYLGKTTVATESEPVGTPIVLAVLGDNAAAQLEPRELAWHSLRKSGFGLSERDTGIFTQALALANWHEAHIHCPRCGTPTLVTMGGWVRRCFKDDAELYPRTDPAIIVAITDSEDRILLGSQGVWEENRWSILAGFVEPGESLNAAVIREMFEEAGVVVEHPQYLGSQAWPFPYSLMLGFAARLSAKSPTHIADGVEIEMLRWFTREELAAEASELLLPARISIARAIIERWYGQSLESATELTQS
jgi:NAD+ diphosphatase